MFFVPYGPYFSEEYVSVHIKILYERERDLYGPKTLLSLILYLIWNIRKSMYVRIDGRDSNENNYLKMGFVPYGSKVLED